MEECHLYYTLEIENYLKTLGYTHFQYPISYWRRDVVFVDFNKKEYRFKAYESNPFNNIIDLKTLKNIILPNIDEAGVVALNVASNVRPKLTAQEEAMFVAGFQECVKYLNMQEDNWIPLTNELPKHREVRASDFYDDQDPRGMSTSEYDDYMKAKKK